MKNELITRHGMEFYANELLEIAQDNKLIVKYNRVYDVKYSENAGFSLNEVYRNRNKLPLTKRGRFHVMSVKEVNSLIGFELLIEA